MATYTAFIFSLRFCGLVDTSIEDKKTLFPPLQTGKIAHTSLVFSAITRETGHSMTTRIMNSRGEGCPSPQAKTSSVLAALYLRDIAYRSLVGRGCHQGVGLQRSRDDTLAINRLPCGISLGAHRNTTLGEFFVGNRQMDATIRDIDLDGIAFFDEANGTAVGSLGRGVTNRETRGAAGKAPIGQQGALLAQPHRFQIRGRIKHLLHAGTTLRTFVANDNHVAGHDFAARAASTILPQMVLASIGFS